ncbi:GTP cyclohydrolase I FolE [Candidatus Sumerlaeota bacterium]|nr:GTP cyclohydrolase I FolE [Candidatus Sumerlaeota bacterium]
MAPLVREMLEKIGEDPTRQGLVKTPARVDRAWAFLTSGYHVDPKDVVNGAIFTEKSVGNHDEMVVVKNIEFYSVCEHHMIPFFGTIHVGYLPNRKVIGLSKIPRLVEVFARRLQVQERLTQQIAESLLSILHPHGVAVVAEARHLCMCMRGVQKQDAVTTTSSMLGMFRKNPQTRNEFLSLIKG